MEILKYKEFEGSAELDMTRNVCRGKILHIDDVVTYESKSIDDLEMQFEEAVDDYIETCNQIGKEPQKACRGQFNVRVSPGLHRAATRRSIADNTSLNDVVCKALEAYLVPATGFASVAATGLEAVGTNIFKGHLIHGLGSADIVRGFGSSATTLRIIQGAILEETAGPERYWEATGSGAEALPEKEAQLYAH